VPRTLSATLAAVVEDLELDQPTVVTTALLREIADRRGLRSEPFLIAARLRKAGWLLPTGRRGVWEFAPGAHAGPIGHGDPTLPLRVALAASPDLPAALALATAAWALGFADRRPATLDVAVPVGTRVPPSLQRSAAVVSFTTNVGYTGAKGVPCHRPESVLVHLAASPTAPRSWPATLEWLPDLAAAAAADTFAAELHARPRAVAVRAGYLLSGLRPDLADPLVSMVGDPVRFGPRGERPVRHVASWRVLDSLLPSDPTTWAPVR
jgi:hypothetical protein